MLDDKLLPAPGSVIVVGIVGDELPVQAVKGAKVHGRAGTGVGVGMGADVVPRCRQAAEVGIKLREIHGTTPVG